MTTHIPITPATITAITTGHLRWLDMTEQQRAAARKQRARIHCGGCENWWTGLRACHCSGCHRTFSGLTAFDLHRIGDHGRGTRHCADPQSVGLVLVDKPGDWASWGQPGTYDGPYEEEDS